MRKSVFMGLVASSLIVFSGATSKAGTLWDIDVFFKYLSGQTTYTDYFDLTGKYDASSETITEAHAWFLVSDDYSWDQEEKIQVKLADEPFRGPSYVSLDLLNGPVTGAALAALDASGVLKYTIKATEGDALALSAKLLVETSPRRVPDGGATLMLLGVVLAGIEPLRRRMARRQTQSKAV